MSSEPYTEEFMSAVLAWIAGRDLSAGRRAG